MTGRVLLAAAAALAAAARPAPAADISYGEYLANECVACHPPDVTDGVIPPLWLLPRDYFVQALREYREGTRDNPVMRSVARSLGEEEIQALADYFEYLGEQKRKGGS
ncbi:Cytochrome subunit of sulfide dehydrogenase [bacterium HR39]|nr:Cytochrome subunit of sulfide dehydrogenase [bacterium HR39]